MLHRLEIVGIVIGVIVGLFLLWILIDEGLRAISRYAFVLMGVGAVLAIVAFVLGSWVVGGVAIGVGLLGLVSLGF